MAKDETYQNAVQEIQTIIQSQKELWYVHDYTFGMLKLDKVKNAAPEDQKEARRYLKMDVIDHLTQHLELSKTTGENYDQLLFVCGMILETDENLSSPLKNFLANHLLQEIKRPIKKGAPKKGNRDIERFEIADYVKKCTDMGLSATRNDTSPATSACDAVSEALRLEGKEGQSYSNVKQVWLENPTVRDDNSEW